MRSGLQWLVLAAFVAISIALAYASRRVPALANWDERVTDAFIAWRSAGWSRTFWAFTLIGDDPLMASFAVALVCLLLTWGRRARAAAVSVGLAAGWAVMHLTKVLVARARPSESLALIQTPASHSMPSGHALISVVFFGLLVYLLTGAARRRNAGPAAPAVAVVLIGVVAAMVGLSRVYLGVHWLSDVIAGWCLGGAVLVEAVRLMAHWQRTGGPAGALRDVEPWRGPWTRAGVAAALAVVICAVAAVTALADPLL
jgi:membrane-associated phospholipid phosphatase